MWAKDSNATSEETEGPIEGAVEGGEWGVLVWFGFWGTDQKLMRSRLGGSTGGFNIKNAHEIPNASDVSYKISL